MKNLAILGSTGSIGRSALAVVDAHPSRLRLVALAAGDNAALLAEQCRRYRPTVAALATPAAVDRLRAACPDADLRAATGLGTDAGVVTLRSLMRSELLQPEDYDLVAALTAAVAIDRVGPAAYADIADADIEVVEGDSEHG